jgi:DNA modification methylase
MMKCGMATTTARPSPKRGIDEAALLQLPREPASGRGRRHGTSSSEPFDRWFRYPAGFASDYVSLLLGHLNVPPRGLVVDCFAGSGVTGTAARQAGLGFFGIEAHPLVAELASLKLDRPSPAIPILEDLARHVVEDATRLVSRRLGRARPAATSQPDLVQRCFALDHLELLVAIRDIIKRRQDEPASAYLKWALLGSLRELASVKVGWPYQRPAMRRRPMFGEPDKRFIARSRLIQDDLSKIASSLDTPLATIYCGDARLSASWNDLEPRTADGCVSSPPYLNNFDYADATRLELYFWGEVTTWSRMCASVRSGMLTATTQQSSVPAASEAIKGLGDFGRTFGWIDSLTASLEQQRKARERGKEYDRMVPEYFLGIAQVLANLATRLKAGAPCVWLIGDSAPYGVYVDTPAIIADLAGHIGFGHEGDLVLRKRGGRWASNTTRHAIQLTERLILLRRR